MTRRCLSFIASFEKRVGANGRSSPSSASNARWNGCRGAGPCQALAAEGGGRKARLYKGQASPATIATGGPMGCSSRPSARAKPLVRRYITHSKFKRPPLSNMRLDRVPMRHLKRANLVAAVVQRWSKSRCFRDLGMSHEGSWHFPHRALIDQSHRARELLRGIQPVHMGGKRLRPSQQNRQYRLLVEPQHNK